MAIKQYVEARIIEKELLEVDLLTKEIYNVELKTVDIIKDKSWVITTIKENLIDNELPTKINATRFRLENDYVSGSLVVYLNGLKEKGITEVSETDFTFDEAIKASDIVECSYIKA